ncbi:MAG: hypothetical protein KKG59_06885 [Nanoarchaeota archaeon]|nr:hypothetical protein [Nanoarchaeota archaeon]
MESMTMLVKELTIDIKKKKELHSLDDDFVSERINLFLKNNSKVYATLKKKDISKVKRSKEYTHIMKIIRKDLREAYGMFILPSYDKKRVDGEMNNILATHQSSKERMHNYLDIYGRIWKSMDTKKTVQILDLGCGMNPVSAPIIIDMTKANITYSAYDISSQDMKFLNQYFKEHKIKGTATALDLSKEEEFHKIKVSEKEYVVCFMFKLLDTLETIKRHTSKKLVAYMTTVADIIVVSFPKTGISGKKNIHTDRRSWFETFLHKESCKYEIFEVVNEIFYIIQTKKQSKRKIQKEKN